MSKKSADTKERKKAIYAEVKSSTIPEELKAVYLMANATELMSVQAFERLKSVYRKHGYAINENELLTGVNQYCRLVRMASFQFFQKIEPQIQGATFFADRDEGDSSGDPEKYDDFMSDTNEICRLVLLYIDRVARSQEGFAKVFRTLRQLPTGGIFRDEDFTRYKMKEIK